MAYELYPNPLDMVSEILEKYRQKFELSRWAYR